MATAPDSNGIPRYDENDVGDAGTFSSLLNKGLGWISNRKSGPPAVLTTAGQWAAWGANQHELINGIVDFTFDLALPSNGAHNANVLIGTLPLGRRPRQTKRFTGMFSGLAKEVVIGTNGEVRISNAVSAGQGGIAVSGTFLAA